MTIVIGTRGSKLALVQANWVSAQLTQHGMDNRIHIIKTKGDVVQDRFDKIEGKGFFTSEIEAALHAGEIDLAVHSLKDLPTESPDGLAIVAIPEREDPYDVLVSTKALPRDERGYPNLDGLCIGTSSNRRVYGLKAMFPNTTYEPIRGNVPTRIAKMQAGQADVLVLAQSGLNRLAMEWPGIHFEPLRPPLLVPAPGQGALGLQTRTNAAFDLSFMHHDHTAECVNAERRVLASLDGGCHLPLGVLIRAVEKGYRLDMFLGDETEKRAAFHFNTFGALPLALAERAMLEIRSRGI